MHPGAFVDVAAVMYSYFGFGSLSGELALLFRVFSHNVDLSSRAAKRGSCKNPISKPASEVL